MLDTRACRIDELTNPVSTSNDHVQRCSTFNTDNFERNTTSKKHSLSDVLYKNSAQIFERMKISRSLLPPFKKLNINGPTGMLDCNVMPRRQMISRALRVVVHSDQLVRPFNPYICYAQ